MKYLRFLLVLSLSLVLVPMQGHAQAQRPPLPRSSVARLVLPEIEAGHAKGMVIGLINKQGRAVYGFGKLGGNRRKAPSGNSIFDIGSITKTFVGVLLAQAVLEGKIVLTDPVSRYLPPNVSIAPYGGDVTVLSLATHSSGLPSRPDNLPIKDPLNPWLGYSVDKMYEYLNTVKLTRPVGTQFEYSNIGAAVAGHILERVYGKPLEVLVKEKLCAPLGMTDTTITLTSAQRARYAVGYAPDLSPVPHWELPSLEGAGAFHSTVNDMLNYAAASMGLMPTPLYSAIKLTHIPRFHVIEQPGMFLGLFWNVLQIDDRQYISHAGGAGGFFALMMMSATDQSGVVLLCNTASDMSDIVRRLMSTLVVQDNRR
ncbi:serine hydrolase domain-containing protein [Desulfovibrio inopinatus]|uniref:serine hydrolase domain-containing protein n=1 Tax=Desulfovibrio inopinatus TaxID=102109 RepID=UPI000410F0C9|nr:serine hydrolase domain-containing protein [Desulfovibrio inopinatus]